MKAMFVAAVEGYPNPFENPKKWSVDLAKFLSRCLRIEPRERPIVEDLLRDPFLGKASSREEMRELVRKIFGTTAPKQKQSALEDKMDVDDDSDS